MFQGTSVSLFNILHHCQTFFTEKNLLQTSALKVALADAHAVSADGTARQVLTAPLFNSPTHKYLQKQLELSPHF